VFYKFFSATHIAMVVAPKRVMEDVDTDGLHALVGDTITNQNPSAHIVPIF